jgi:hypothetical protein
MGFYPIKSFCKSKEATIKIKGQSQNGRRSWRAIHWTNNYYAEYIKSSKKPISNPINKWAVVLRRSTNGK